MGITHFRGSLRLVPGVFRVDEVQWRMKSAFSVLLVMWMILVCGQVKFNLEEDICTGFRDIVSEVNEEVLSSFCFLGAVGISVGFMVDLFLVF